MRKALIVVDMQKDFIDGSLGTKEAVSIVPKVIQKIKTCKSEDYDIIFTQDTHGESYLSTKEGENLPVVHCVKGTTGWNLYEDILPLSNAHRIFEKHTFGSIDLSLYLEEESYDRMEFVGLCTDICVISNTLMAKAVLPESDIIVDSSCCAGVTPKSHENALEAMKMCHIKVI